MLEQVLNENEEKIQCYLEANEKILIATCGMPAYYYNYVIPKFKFGNDFVSDFVILTGQSFSYWITLIELEPANVKIFTKNGDYAQHLNHAIKQVDDWGDWIKSNESYFKTSLLKAIKKHDPSFDVTFDYARRFIISKKIIIGRRDTLTEDDNKRRAIELEKSRLDIITYDRLIEIEAKIVSMENKGEPFCKFRPHNY